MRLLTHPRALVEKDQIGVFDDFLWFVTAHQWTSVLTDTGTAAVGDSANGIVVLTPSDGTVADNDEAYLKSTAEVFKFATQRAIYGECLLQFTEANTDDANVFFGFLDNIAANTIVDDGAGLKTSFSGAAIYKVDGGTVWRCVTSNGSSQSVTISTKTAGGSSYQRLRIELREVDGTNMEVTFFVDDQPLLDSNYRRPIKHNVAIASATEMQVGCGVKNGSTNLETLNVDYIAAYQLR